MDMVDGYRICVKSKYTGAGFQVPSSKFLVSDFFWSCEERRGRSRRVAFLLCLSLREWFGCMIRDAGYARVSGK